MESRAVAAISKRGGKAGMVRRSTTSAWFSANIGAVTHAGTLSEEYPEFGQVRTDRKLGNIKKDLELPQDASLNEVRRELKRGG